VALLRLCTIAAPITPLESQRYELIVKYKILNPMKWRGNYW